MRFPGSHLRADRTLQFVVLMTLLALLLRVVLLGVRVAHYDEGRVAYWTLHYLRSGEFHYRFIIHGPFIQHVNRVVFTAIGVSDFATRLPVAIVGGLLPLTALLFRGRLRDQEVAGMALFLSLNPIILYYSRFMRSTALVAAFCLLAFALFVRTYDGHGKANYYFGMIVLALGFVSKENAAVYVLTWLGAGLLIADGQLVRPGGTSAYVRLRDRLRSINRGVSIEWLRTGLIGLLLFALVALFFYAPRDPNGVGLWSSLADPTQLPALLDRTLTDIWTGYSYWFSGPGETTLETYIEWMELLLSTGAMYAGPLLWLSIAGFLAERFLTARPRPLVMFASYWGFVSLLGYPLATDVWGAWIIVNALVPLVIPAAVGLEFMIRIGREALASNDQISVTLVSVILLVLMGQMALAGATGIYTNPTGAENDLVQYAQPQQEMRGALEDMRTIAGQDHEGTEVLVYGSPNVVDVNPQGPRKPACIQWFTTLPLAWYVEAYELEVRCASSPGSPPGDVPSIVVAEANCTRTATIECRTRPADLRVPSGLRNSIPEDHERYAFLHRTTGGTDVDGIVIYTRT